MDSTHSSFAQGASEMTWPEGLASLGRILVLGEFRARTQVLEWNVIRGLLLQCSPTKVRPGARGELTGLIRQIVYFLDCHLKSTLVPTHCFTDFAHVISPSVADVKSDRPDTANVTERKTN